MAVSRADADELMDVLAQQLRDAGIGGLTGSPGGRMNSAYRNMPHSGSISPPVRRRLWAPTRPADKPAQLPQAQQQPRGWQHLPPDVVGLVVAHLSLLDLRAARLVCREWHRSISAGALHLRPRRMRSTRIPSLFPSLQSLDLRRCRQLGDADLEALSSVTALRTLSLEGQEDVTDDIAAQLAALPHLRALSLRHCIKLGTDVALATLCGGAGRLHATQRRGGCSPLLAPRRSLPSSPAPPPQATAPSPGSSAPAAPPPLEFLDVAGCIMLTEAGFSSLAAGLPNLRELHIGGCSRVSTITDRALQEVGRLTGLQLLDLSGAVNVTNAGLAHLSALSSLSSLSLWNCIRLTPDGLAALSSLLRLADVSFRGCQQMTDAALGHLTVLAELRELDFRACEHLRGEQLSSLSRLQRLSSLNLRSCYALSDAGLSALSYLRHLSALQLQDCWQVTTAGLQRLSALMQLTELNMQGCRNLVNPLGASLPALSALSLLQVLNLRNCDRLVDGALGFATALGQLTQLDASGCRELTGAALAPLAGASRLAALRMQHCPGIKGGGGLRHLSALLRLTSLQLGGCTSLVGSALSSLRPLGVLRHLSLEGWHAAPLLDRGLAAVGAACCSLTSICLQGCSTLGDDGVAELGRLTALESANLNDCCSITGAGFGGWSALARLTALSLQGCAALDDPGAAALACATAISQLNMRNCKGVGDAGVGALAPALQRLTSLSLQGQAALTDGGVAALTQLRSLQDLELQFCWHFGDAGVRELSALSCLSRLDLMYSWKVTDEALAALAGMTSLLCLNVRGCHRLTAGGKAAVAHLLHDPLHTHD